MQQTTQTVYAAARGQEVIADAVYTDLDTAAAQVNVYRQQMTDLGLEPDIDLVQLDVKTSYGRLKRVDLPAEEAETSTDATPDPDTEDAGDSDTGDSSAPPPEA